MQLPESWLRTLVDPDLTTTELGNQLTMVGLEVEKVTSGCCHFSKVVVAHIVSVVPHPNVSRLKVCQVNDGSVHLLQIVCSAENLSPGLKVPFARIGAELPGGVKIRLSEIHGVLSSGMLCSGYELGLSPDQNLFKLPKHLIPGTVLQEALALNNKIFHLKLTPNRADCLSVLGIAREVSAFSRAKLNTPRILPFPLNLEEQLKIKIDAPELCGRFAGRVIRGINAKSYTPMWMRTRLEQAGQQCTSALIDISNYVMLELGGPSHFFDLDKVYGDITVRRAKKGEFIKPLGKEAVFLDENCGVVVVNNQVESLGGIIDSESTSISLETRNAYLGFAFWLPQALSGLARHYKFQSESAYRFERGVDYEKAIFYIDMATSLILDICGGEAGPVNDQVVNIPQRKPINMRLSRCCRLLGIPLNSDKVSEIFKNLNFSFFLKGDVFVVSPPSYRFDLQIEEDLIEEIIRLYGFDNIPCTPATKQATMMVRPEKHSNFHSLRHLTASQGYQEIVNYSFVNETLEKEHLHNNRPIKIINPISSCLSTMRSSLIPGLIENICYNANRQQTRIRIFELGRVYINDPDAMEGPWSVAGISQPLRLAGAAWGNTVQEQWGEPIRLVDFYDVKRDVEVLCGAKSTELRFHTSEQNPALHPGRSACVELGSKVVGWIGELHPQWTESVGLKHSPIVFELDVAALSDRKLPVIKELPCRPMVIRDLAFWVGQKVTAQSMLDTIAHIIRSDPSLTIVKDFKIFDVWQDKGKKSEESSKEKSFAFRFWLQSDEVALGESQVCPYLDRIRRVLVSRHNAHFRSLSKG